MAKSTKIIAIILCSLVAACCVTVGVGTVLNDKDTENLPTVSQTQSTAPTVSSTAEPTTEKKDELSELILGKWRDSADMSGFEFFPDGIVEITYVNLTVPVINLPVNGTTKGSYSLEGDKLTTKFSIYSATIEDTYKVSVKGNELSMTNLEDSETATYLRAKETETTEPVKQTTEPTSKKTDVLYDDEIIGSWVSFAGDEYEFDYDGEAEIEIGGKEYEGIYVADGSKITLQYKKNGNKVTEKYNYTVNKNSLTLKGDGAEILLTRKGTGTTVVSDDDLYGVWRDSANMSGFEFGPDGICKITYVNFTVPVVNIPINGTFTGSYSVSGNKITISATIYGSSIRDVYEFSVSGNTLTMKNLDTSNVQTLTKQ